MVPSIAKLFFQKVRQIILGKNKTFLDKIGKSKNFRLKSLKMNGTCILYAIINFTSRQFNIFCQLTTGKHCYVVLCMSVF